MRDHRRNPVPGRYRYPQRPPPAAARSRGRGRLWVALAAGLAVLAVGAAVVVVWALRDSPEVDAGERAAIESFARAVLDVEQRRASTVSEFEQVGVEIQTTEFEVVYGVLDSVILQQERLILEVQSIDSSSTATALAHTLLEDSYEDELEGYRLLRVVVGLAEVVFPGGTARRARRMDGYQSAVGRLTRAEYSRGRAYEELEEVLARVGLSLEDVRRTEGGDPAGRTAPRTSPNATPESGEVVRLEPSLTAEESVEAILFADRMLDLEVKQRQIVHDYRMYEIDLLTRWIGDSVAGAEALLERQRGLLGEVRSVDVGQAWAGSVRALYEESFEEGVWAFEGMVLALEPLNEAGVSVAFGIRSGMLIHSGASDGLSRSAMSRRSARAELESLLVRAGTTLGEIERARDGGTGDL